jgi:HemY protein
VSVFRWLLFWLALALVGAWAWDSLSAQSGLVEVTWRGMVYSMRLPVAIAAVALAWFAISLLWWLLALPWRSWRRHVRRLVQRRLLHGLEALQEGRWERAQSLLERASEEDSLAHAALAGLCEAAEARGDDAAAERALERLAATAAPLAAGLRAERALRAGQAEAALRVLDGIGDRELTPRARLAKARALAAAGRAAEALDLLDALRHEHAATPAALLALEIDWRAAALVQAGDADRLQSLWKDQARDLRSEPAVVQAYARRAAALGLNAEAHQALRVALEERWDPATVDCYGRLPGIADDRRLPAAEAWLETRSEDAALQLCLGRLYAMRELPAKAEAHLRRAIALDAGAAAWEALGDLHSAHGEVESAQVAYANALRVPRGLAARVLAGRSLREQIAAEASAEQRNEHGLPVLPRQ